MPETCGRADRSRAMLVPVVATVDVDAVTFVVAPRSSAIPYTRTSHSVRTQSPFLCSSMVTSFPVSGVEHATSLLPPSTIWTFVAHSAPPTRTLKPLMGLHPRQSLLVTIFTCLMVKRPAKDIFHQCIVSAFCGAASPTRVLVCAQPPHVPSGCLNQRVLPLPSIA